MPDSVDQIADSVIRDSQGTAFDPAIHGTSTDGKPSTKKDGTFRNRRKTHASAEFEEATQRAEGGPDPAALGVAVSRTFLTCCMLIGGEGWKPAEQEALALDGAWAQYFQARGVESIPPEALLLAALTAYAGPRLAQSKAPSKMGKWISEKIFRRRANASADLWPNGQREDESRDESVESVPEPGQNGSGFRSV